ncbi:DUF3859 domain-containing protein [Pseudoalteromonas sp. SMS1]|uniref:DUF3859 domain-containing protein n=1 Tax=Pseudoalteromonas sp. SMS1 TaxID=2908894 RepID=UPI001F35942A|nr:DUF3859 domain-containing protein [Pseudoalteromonas sp. SMS1]MCF2856668.1 DUF3859 domain-containing protein [Pseudoalteromonas sp. SMS1]
MIRHIYFLVVSLFCTVAYAAPAAKSDIESIVFMHSYIEKVGGEVIHEAAAVNDVISIGERTKTLKERTWVIPNKLGTGFEIGVAFLSIPQQIQHFDLRITYPKTTLPSGETRSQLERKIDISGHQGEYVWGFAYYFDFPYETTPGDWHIEIRAKGSLIHHSKFTVVAEN